MTPVLTPRQREARAIATNGEGRETKAHLNLTRSLADFPEKEPPRKKVRKLGRPKGPNLTRPRYAGDERYEPSEPSQSVALHWSVPAFPNRFAAKRRTFKD